MNKFWKWVDVVFSCIGFFGLVGGLYFHFQVMARMHERINEMAVKLSEMELNLLESRIEFNKKFEELEAKWREEI